MTEHEQQHAPALSAISNPATTADKPEDLSRRASELASDASRLVADRANAAGDQGMTSLGRRVHEAADHLEQRGRRLAQENDNPVEARHVDAVAAPVRRAGDYLIEREPKDVFDDIDRSVRANPYRAMAVGAAVGWFVGRFLSRRD